MSTLSEIENAVESLPREEQEELMRHLSAKLRPQRLSVWPVPPPSPEISHWRKKLAKSPQ